MVHELSSRNGNSKMALSELWKYVNDESQTQPQVGTLAC